MANMNLNAKNSHIGIVVPYDEVRLYRERVWFQNHEIDLAGTAEIQDAVEWPKHHNGTMRIVNWGVLVTEAVDKDNGVDAVVALVERIDDGVGGFTDTEKSSFTVTDGQAVMSVQDAPADFEPFDVGPKWVDVVGVPTLYQSSIVPDLKTRQDGTAPTGKVKIWVDIEIAPNSTAYVPTLDEDRTGLPV